MRAKLGNHLVLVVIATLLASKGTASADFAQCANPLPACSATVTSCCTTTFPSSGGYNALIMPTDRCHQSPNGHIAPGLNAPRRQVNVSSWTRAGSTVTVTTSAAHGLTSNKDTEVVRVVGLSGITNGSYVVKTGVRCSPTCTATTFEFTASSGTSGTSGYILPHNLGQGWCGDAPGSATRVGGSTADAGMVKMYGLLYRLMQQGVPVYWLVNPSKTAVALTYAEANADQNYVATDVDAWVVTSDITDPPDAVTGLTSCPAASCTQPVRRLNTDLTTRSDSYAYKEFPLRGGAFVIAAADRAKFNAFWARTGSYASLASQTKYDFSASGIDFYELDASAKFVHQNFAVGDGIAATSRYTTIVGAPVAVKIDYEPPRVACIGCNSAVAQNWLDSAGLMDPAEPASCATGEFVPSDATYCVINDYDIAQGTLVTGGFGWAWVFDYTDSSPCATSGEKAVFDKLRDFLTTVPAIRNAGHSVFLDSSIKTAEGCSNKQLLGIQGPLASNRYAFDFSGANVEPYIFRYPTNLLMQTGDIPYKFASGSVAGWKYYDSTASYIGYQPALAATGSSLRRLVTVDSGTACIEHTSTASCDVFSSTGDLFDAAVYGRLGNVLANGLAFYLPGNQLDNNGNVGELRTLLNTLIALPDESYSVTPVDTEVARASPVISPVVAGGEPNVFTGTYVRRFPIPNIPRATTTGGLNRYTFPYIQGHMRAIPISQYSACTAGSCATDNTARSTYASMTATFDAANGIPPVTTGGCTTNYAGNCRTVFTALGTPTTGTKTTRFASHTFLVDTDAAMNGTLGTLLSTNLTLAEKKTFLGKILKGYFNTSTGLYESKLGGVDRSTPAVIGPSPLAGSDARPTMAYFGATDGMLHAVCVEVNTAYGCDVAGRELWAFVPRTLLPDFKNSTVRVDGSPHVIDGYADYDQDGDKEWATILVVHTGTGVMTNAKLVPAVYAIDITIPNAPKVLWEYAVVNVGARGSIEMGIGLNVTSGQVTVGTTKTSLAFIQTTNGGVGGAGSVVTALDIATGLVQWQRGDIYPTNGGASARNTAHEAAPSSGVPGGAVGIDKTGTGDITHVVYGNLYGDVWVRNAGTGVAQNGTAPLMRISTDYKPVGVSPAIYKIGNTQYAAFATGGYADTQSTLWRGSNETPPPTQMVFSVNLDYTGTTSLTETAGSPNVPVKFDFTSNAEGGFAQVIILGTELFVVTDNTNVNSYDYGSYANPTGKVYRVELGGSSPALEASMVIAGGAASLFNSSVGLFTGGGAYGERLTTNADSTTGTNPDPKAMKTTTTRKLWLRTE